MGKIKRTVRIFDELTGEAFGSLLYAVQFNLRYVANIIQIATPYAMYVLGCGKGAPTIGWELLIPACVVVFTFYIKGFANKANHGSNIPVPNERFTEVDGEGVVTIREDRLQELLLYTADLEDWMVRKGWL